MANEIMDETAARAPAEGQLERERPYFAPGQAAEHPFGVLYQGEYETLGDGTAIAVRRHATALAATGIPVQLRSFSNIVVNRYGVREPAHLGIPAAVEAEVGALRKTSVQSLIPVLKHAVIANAEHARNILVPHGAIGSDTMATVELRRAICQNTILYTVWERNRIDEGLVRELSRVAQLWVPCQQNATMLANSGVPQEKIHVVPHPYRPDDDLTKLLDRKPTDWRLFYSIGRWEPRKAYAELITAFLRAFTPSDKVMLTIKYSGSGNWDDYPTPQQAVDKALAEPTVNKHWTLEKVRERVHLIDRHLSASGIIELHFRNNIYVSCSHGEAWNFGAFEAKQAGNALVYVPWGGVSDYAGASVDVPVPLQGKEPVHTSYRWPDAQWASYDINDLVTSLRLTPAPLRYVVPARLQRCTMNAVGAQMRELVLQLADERAPAAAAYYRSKNGK
jgi:glycosyltransferase involved in cell wall biosynthesis